METKWDIGNKIGNSLELSFKTVDIELAYKKALVKIEAIKYSHIKEKKQNISIKANLGRKVAFRVKGYLFSDMNEWRKNIFVDFNENKITVIDDMKGGIKCPLSGKIIRNMRETGDMVKDAIEK